MAAARKPADQAAAEAKAAEEKAAAEAKAAEEKAAAEAKAAEEKAAAEAKAAEEKAAAEAKAAEEAARVLDKPVTFTATHGVDLANLGVRFELDAERTGNSETKVYRLVTEDAQVAAAVREIDDYGIAEVKDAGEPAGDSAQD